MPSVEKSYIVKTGKGYHIYLRLTDKAFALISKKATHHIFYPDKKLADKKIKLDSVKTEELTVDSKSKKIVVDDRIGLEGLKSQELLKSDGYVVGYKVGELKVCRGYVIGEGSIHPSGWLSTSEVREKEGLSGDIETDKLNKKESNSDFELHEKSNRIVYQSQTIPKDVAYMRADVMSQRGFLGKQRQKLLNGVFFAVRNILRNLLPKWERERKKMSDLVGKLALGEAFRQEVGEAIKPQVQRLENDLRGIMSEESGQPLEDTAEYFSFNVMDRKIAERLENGDDLKDFESWANDIVYTTYRATQQKIIEKAGRLKQVVDEKGKTSEPMGTFEPYDLSKNVPAGQHVIIN